MLREAAGFALEKFSNPGSREVKQVARPGDEPPPVASPGETKCRGLPTK